MRTFLPGRRGRLALIPLLALACAFLASAMNGGTTASADLAADQTLRLAVSADPVLDPAKGTGPDDAMLSNAVFEGLTRIDSADVVQPALAASWTKTSAGKVWTFTLRDGIQWSNGNPITASDVVYGVLRSLDPKTNAPFVYQLYDIKGAWEYNNGKGPKSGVKVKALGTTKVQFTLENPIPWFDRLVSVGVAYPVPGSVIASKGNAWTTPANIVTSGPFTLTAQAKGTSFTLTKSATYHGAASVALQTVNAQVVKKSSTASVLFNAGALDTGLPSALVGDAEFASAKTDARFVSKNLLNEQYLWFNAKSPTLKKKVVRRTLARALNRSKLVSSAVKGRGLALGTSVPVGIEGYASVKAGAKGYLKTGTPAYAALAKSLRSAGVPRGASLNLWYTTEGSAVNGRVAKFIKAEYAKVGITVVLHPVSTANKLYTITTRPIAAKYSMVLLGWIADYNAAFNFHSLHQCQSSYNISQLCSQAFDNVTYAEASMSKTARLAASKKAEGMVVGPDGSFPVAPLYQGTDDTLVQPWVTGFALNAEGLVDLSKISIEAH